MVNNGATETKTDDKAGCRRGHLMIDRSLPQQFLLRSTIYSKYGHFWLLVVLHKPLADVTVSFTQICTVETHRNHHFQWLCVYLTLGYMIFNLSPTCVFVYTICSRHSEPLSTSSASNALCGISHETPETLDMRSEHKPPPKSHS